LLLSQSVGEDRKSLLREATAATTPPERLEELAASSDPEVAQRALGQLVRTRVREHLHGALKDPSDPHAQAVGVFALMVELLNAMPGRIAAFSASEVDDLFASVFGTGEEEHAKLYSTALRSLLDGVLASRGPKVEEIARGLASSWAFSLLDLMDAAQAVPARAPK
jgi:hypothetical protein